MHILPVNNTLYNNNKQCSAANRQAILMSKPAETRISFKSVFITYKIAKAIKKQIRKTIVQDDWGLFKERLSENIINHNDAVSTLSTLAKLGSEAVPIRASLLGGFNREHRILKDSALKGLFPYIPELPNDSEGGHSAKFDFLYSMVKTGDYLTSFYFYDVMKNLPPSYNSEKATLLQNMLTNNNLKTELEKLYVEGEVIAAKEESPLFKRPDKEAVRKQARIEVYKLFDVVNYALLKTLDHNTNQTFFARNKGNIARTQQAAYRNILHDQTVYKNKFYGLYVDGFKSDTLFVPELVVAKEVFWNGLAHFQNNKADGMKYFNFDEEYFDDILKDYNIYKVLNSQEPLSDAQKNDIIMKRFQEKQASPYDDIRSSAGMFLSSAGRLGERILLQELLQELETEEKELAPIVAGKRTADKFLSEREMFDINVTYTSIKRHISIAKDLINNNSPIKSGDVNCWGIIYDRAMEYIGSSNQSRKNQKLLEKWLEIYTAKKPNTTDTDFGPYYDLITACKNREESKKLDLEYKTCHYEILY